MNRYAHIQSANHAGRERAPDAGLPQCLIETFVGKGNVRVIDFFGKIRAPALSLLAAHFEDVREIGPERDGYFYVDRFVPVIMNGYSVEAITVGKKLSAIDMQRS